MMKFTACYTKIDNGYMGQLLEWPNVITEGETLNDCREMLIDAAGEMAIVYREDGLKIPQPEIFVEHVDVNLTPPSTKVDTSPSQGRHLVSVNLRPLKRGRGP